MRSMRWIQKGATKPTSTTIITVVVSLIGVILIHFIQCTYLLCNNNHNYIHNTVAVIVVNGFSFPPPTMSIIFLAAARRRPGNLQRSLDGDDINASKKKKAFTSATTINQQGKGQIVTGVTLPTEGTIKGWEFGNNVRLVCCNVNGRYYALQGECPRCGFDLYRGDLISNDEAWDDLPRVACPTCATTYSMNTGTYGPPIKRTGLQGFITGLAKQSTNTAAYASAKTFIINVDETDGTIYCR